MFAAGIFWGDFLKRKVVIAALAAAVSGCVSTPPPTKSTPYTLSASEIDLLKKGVTATLKDPLSALYGDKIVASQASGAVAITICGTVNAKNSFGGYTGAKPFMVEMLPGSFFGNNGMPSFTVQAMGGDDFATNYTINKCAQAGLVV